VKSSLFALTSFILLHVKQRLFFCYLLVCLVWLRQHQSPEFKFLNEFLSNHFPAFAQLLVHISQNNLHSVTVRRHEASRGLSATAELLVCFNVHCVSKNAPTLQAVVSTSMYELWQFLVNIISTLSKMIRVFNFPYPFTFTYFNCFK